MFKILAIEIITGNNTMDNVILFTDLPASTYHKGNETLLMFATNGLGEQYVEKNFPGIPYKITNRPPLD